MRPPFAERERAGEPVRLLACDSLCRGCFLSALTARNATADIRPREEASHRTGRGRWSREVLSGGEWEDEEVLRRNCAASAVAAVAPVELPVMALVAASQVPSEKALRWSSCCTVIISKYNERVSTYSREVREAKGPMLTESVVQQAVVMLRQWRRRYLSFRRRRGHSNVDRGLSGARGGRGGTRGYVEAGTGGSWCGEGW